MIQVYIQSDLGNNLQGECTNKAPAAAPTTEKECHNDKKSM